MKFPKIIVGFSLFFASNFLVAQPAPQGYPEPISSALQEHFLTAIKRWNAGQSSIPNNPVISASIQQSMASSDFVSVRDQLRKAGARAWPLSKSVAEQLQLTSSNQYDLAWILTDMTPAISQTADLLAQTTQMLHGTDPADRLIALARLGKATNALSTVELIAPYATSNDPKERIVALVALGFAGKNNPTKAAPVLGNSLKDSEKYNRTAAMNSLRMLGSENSVAVYQNIADYLKTRDNVFMATRVLKNFPLEYIKPLKSEFEAIVKDSRLTEFQKRDAVDTLMKIELAN